MIPIVGVIAGAANLLGGAGAGGLLAGAGGGGAFQAALSTAASALGMGGGANGQLDPEKMIQAGMQVMMPMMNQVIQDALEGGGDEE